VGAIKIANLSTADASYIWGLYVLLSCFNFGCRRKNTTDTLNEVLHAFLRAAPEYRGLPATSHEKQKKVLFVLRLH
jgi:hypothetical protein